MHTPANDPATDNLGLNPDGRLCLLEKPEQNAYEMMIIDVARHPNADATGSSLFWRQVAKKFLIASTRYGHVDHDLDNAAAEALLHEAPLMPGGEFLNETALRAVWRTFGESLQGLSFGQPLAYLQSQNACWQNLGKVCLNLAENRRDLEKPFAFLATYIVGVNASGNAQHTPFARVLQTELDKKDSAILKKLLDPLREAARQSTLLANLISSRKIFSPQAWSAQEAFLFLQDISIFEDHGIVVQVPNWWTSQKRPRPKVTVTVGEKKKGSLGPGALLSFHAELSLNDQVVSDKEWEELLRATSNLVQIRGQWVEVKRDDLREVLAYWRHAQEAAYGEGLSFSEAMRVMLKLGSASQGEELSAKISTWSDVKAGTWLADALEKLRDPQNIDTDNLKDTLRATLRPYQRLGVKWLWHLYQLGLGGCLADDMGLGKTIQVIALLLLIKYRVKQNEARSTSLLVLPASLIGNWKSEIERFAPSLEFTILHPAYNQKLDDDINCDVAITSYGFLSRNPAIRERTWDLVILDEAQAIKNPSTNQTLKIKALKTTRRLAMTGTPVENRLTDLWSLFDFLNPGLLGKLPQFQSMFTKDVDQHASANLRKLVKPYILRRLKTDKKIIDDLPPKTEVELRCGLTPRQAALYENTVQDFATELRAAEGITRRGVILGYLSKFKQICNHPAQYTGTGDYIAGESGKFLALARLTEELTAKQEKLLVFSQYQTMSYALMTFLSSLYGREGLVLTGNTPIKARKIMVDSFQRPEGPPFFILSLKAGGTGLNLTAASQVLHFDRWWNPAVENQATDRAFRIGQKRHVVVHKMVCIGTIEEKIAAMIKEKNALADSILKGDQDINLTEMSNEDLLKLVALDINKIKINDEP